MKNIRKNPKATVLRKKAVELLKKKSLKRDLPLSEADALKLNQKLEVHQIELELQNEELIAAKAKIEHTNEKYTELYDFAPIGYITLSKEGSIINMNISGAQMLGKGRSSLINSRFGFFVTDETKPVYNHFLDMVFTSKVKQSCEVTLSGNVNVPIYVRLDGIVSKNKKDCLLIVSDVTDRKLAEELISNLLKEKELILKEVHHRIKNNMSTIKSLLIIQADSVRESAAAAALSNAAGRVMSMMVLYDKLYNSSDFNIISVSEYLAALIDEIINTFQPSIKIKTEKLIEDHKIEVQKVLPVGIIINELLTNIMKYAFISRQEGLIRVSAKIVDKFMIITLQDNGVGLPESINFTSSTGFGMQLIGMLTEQINGTIRIERGNGTKFILEFPIN